MTEIQPLTIYTADQQPVALAALARERPVLIFFLRHPGCAICRQKLFELKRRAADFRAAGVELAAITMAAPVMMGELEKRYELSFPMYSDPNGGAYRALGFVEVPLSQLDTPETLRYREQAIQQGFKVEDSMAVPLNQLGGLALFAPGQYAPHSVHIANPIYAYPDWDDVLTQARTLLPTA